MAGKTARDVGTVINRLARFAVGAGTAQPSSATGGIANAGTSASIKDRLSGGFSAISEPFRAGIETKSRINLQSSQINRNNALAAQDRLETEAANKPFDISSLIGGVDPTGTLSQKIQPILQQAGIDKDGNGIVTNAELQEGLRSGNIDLSEISKAIGDTVQNVTKQEGVNASVIAKKKEELALKVPGLGVGFTDEEFLNSPTLVAMDKELATLMNRQKTTSNQKQLLASRIGMIDKFQQDIKDRKQAGLTFTPEIQTELDTAFNGLNLINKAEDNGTLTSEQADIRKATLVRRAMGLVPAEKQRLVRDNLTRFGLVDESFIDRILKS